MTNMLHMNSYLVSAARFQFALNKRNIFEPFNYSVMSDSFFSVFTIGINIHDFSEALMPAHMAPDGAGFFFEITPYKRMISSFHCVIKKLVAKVKAGFIVFCHEQ